MTSRLIKNGDFGRSPDDELLRSIGHVPCPSYEFLLPDFTSDILTNDISLAWASSVSSRHHSCQEFSHKFAYLEQWIS